MSLSTHQHTQNTPITHPTHSNAVVDQVLAFGCIVRFGVTRSGMVHVSELDVRRTAVVEDAWKEGDVMDVKIIEVMGNGNIRLSRKAVLVDDAAAQV